MQRPLFHIAAEKGWINDPNGPVFYKDYYHVFFQYHPYSTQWGPMHWGHVRSNDLIKWEHLPVALTPGDEVDKDGCFSGSAAVVGERLYLMYTGVVNRDGNCYQSQCVAYSDDGVHFTKFPKIVIGGELLPEGFSPYDFRDPCVFVKDGFFYALVAARKGDSSDILLFRSSDLKEWRCNGSVLDYPSTGKMIECPCWSEKEKLLLYSDQFSVPEECRHLNIHSNFYRAGTLDCDTATFRTEKEGIVDYGFDFYAAQFFANTDKTIMIAWMQMWDRNIPCCSEGFAGMLTLPRYVENRNGAIYQTPVSLEKYVIRRECFEKKDFAGTLKTQGEAYELVIEGKGVKNLVLEVKKSDTETTKIGIEGGFLVFDRSRSGEKIEGAEKDALSLAQIRKIPLNNVEDLKIQVVVDRFSVEVFAEGKAMSNTVYPKADANGVELNVDAHSVCMEIKHLSVD